jgi:GntR family transcriptional regulator, N-acetylglucosamine utilization regulator
MKTADVFDPAAWLSENAGPRYIQLKRRLESLIEERRLPPGTPLPPEREIAKLTGLSRVTVRKAVAPLVEAGLIEQRQGSGTIVAAPLSRVEQSLSRLSSFTEDMARRGMDISQVWLSRGVFVPTPEEIMTFGLGAHQMVSRLERLRFADGTPMAIERAALPTDILPNPLEVETSLYAVMEQHGRRPVRAVQHITAANLGKKDAELLDVEEGIAALKIARVSYLGSGRVAEFTKSIYRGDAYDFVAELQLVESERPS